MTELVVGRCCWVSNRGLKRLGIVLAERRGTILAAVERESCPTDVGVDVSWLADAQIFTGSAMPEAHLGILDEIALLTARHKHFCLAVCCSCAGSFKELVIPMPVLKGTRADGSLRFRASDGVLSAAIELHQILSSRMPETWQLDLLIWESQDAYQQRHAPPYPPDYVDILRHGATALVRRYCWERV